MDVSPEAPPGLAYVPLRRSFNPCSRGCFARRPVAKSIRLEKLVSILVLVDVSPEVRRRAPIAGFCGVSILVLVDVSLEDFNPEECAVIVEVSILVLVDVSPEAPHLCRAERPAMVSILVLVDVSPEARTFAEQRDQRWFQSLFSWMFRSKSGEQLNSGLLWGFNPCSLGCFARSLRVVVIPDHDTQFQSLFSWMFRPKYPRIAISCLFCGFNPCSRGCFARRQVSCRSLGHLHVSILVLVDVSPEACQMTWPGSFPWCFNPCSRGCFARRGVFLAEGPHPGWFQSLFSWMFRSKDRRSK